MKPFRKRVIFLIGHERIGKMTLTESLSRYLSHAKVWDFHELLDDTRSRLHPDDLLDSTALLETQVSRTLDRLSAELSLDRSGAGEGPKACQGVHFVELPPDFNFFQHPIFSLPDHCIVWLRRRLDRWVGLGSARTAESFLPRSPNDCFEERLFRERYYARFAHDELLLADEDQGQGLSLLLKAMQGDITWTDAGLLLPKKSTPNPLENSLYFQGTQPMVITQKADEAPALKEESRTELASLQSLRLSGQIKWEDGIETWAAFQKVYAEWRADSRASFLALLSEKGRWKWLHQALVQRTPRSLLKMSLGLGVSESMPDLPLPDEWLLARARTHGFGIYITHRFSSRATEWVRVLHQPHFDSFDGLFLSVPLLDEEFCGAVADLQREWGVTRIALSERFAHLASPLCEGRLSLRARRTGLVDTLFFGTSGWQGDHAAVGALRKCARDWRRSAGERGPRAPMSLLAAVPRSHEVWIRDEFPQGHLAFVETLEAGTRMEGRRDWDWVVLSDSVDHTNLKVLKNGLSSARGVVELGVPEETLGTELAWQLRSRYVSPWSYIKALAFERMQFWTEQGLLVSSKN